MPDWVATPLCLRVRVYTGEPSSLAPRLELGTIHLRPLDSNTSSAETRSFNLHYQQPPRLRNSTYIYDICPNLWKIGTFAGCRAEFTIRNANDNTAVSGTSAIPTSP